MRDFLAEKLLSKAMGWNTESYKREMKNLLYIAACKYDKYGQFFPGRRFIESFALWLNQFESEPERVAAYNLVRRSLIFVSPAQMHHLISLCYPDIISPILIRKLSADSLDQQLHVRRIIESRDYLDLKRQSLFLGMSDGAHTDIFRRDTPLSNEQIYQVYELDDERLNDMVHKLKVEVGDTAKFKLIFLLDDFSGSGISYISMKEDGTFSGKLDRFVKSKVFNDLFSHRFDEKDLEVILILYLGTLQAKQHIEKLGNQIFQQRGIKFSLHIIQELNDSIIIRKENNPELFKVLEKYFDPQIIDEHYMKGKHSHPYLGFDECSLPLVIYHNCPNNSLPLLWFNNSHKVNGLFPRVLRHKE